MAMHLNYPPLEGGSESEAIRGGVCVSASDPSSKNSAPSLRSVLEFYRPSLKGRVEYRA
jgi:hypothetical protein